GSATTSPTLRATSGCSWRRLRSRTNLIETDGSGGTMQTIAKFWRTTRLTAREFLADGRGLAATEFAVVVPLMLVMFFGTVEFSSAVAIDRKVTLMARTLSDLTSQSTSVADTDMTNFFAAS